MVVPDAEKDDDKLLLCQLLEARPDIIPLREGKYNWSYFRRKITCSAQCDSEMQFVFVVIHGVDLDVCYIFVYLNFDLH